MKSRRNVVCKPRNANASQVNTRIPNDFLNRLDKKVLPLDYKSDPRDFDFLSKIFLSVSLSQEWTRIGIFVGNRLIDFIVDPIEIFAVVVNALTTVKRLRQTVLGLNRVTRHSKVSMIRVHILSARHVFAAVFLNRLIDRFSIAGSSTNCAAFQRRYLR